MGKVEKNNSSLTILQAMEIITTGMKKDQQHDLSFNKYKKEIETISDIMSLSSIQSVLFSFFVSRCNEFNIFASEIGNDLNCSNIQMLMWQADIDVLVARKLIRKRTNEKLSYHVPSEVLLSLKDNKCFIPESLYCKTCTELFVRLDLIFNAKDDEGLTFNSMLSELESLLDANHHLLFVTKIRSYGHKSKDLALLLCFCHLFVNNGDDGIRFHDIDFLFDNKLFAHITKQELENGTSFMFLNGYIEYVNSGGFQDKECWKMTENKKRELFPELNLPSLSMESPKQDVICHKNIVAKSLFYTQIVDSQVSELQQLLTHKNFRQIQKRMKTKGMRCGFACLFYGAPGTGKTETVMQLARMTGRDIMLIDIPKIRSCWVGETEKNIKDVFDRYRSLVKDSKLAPILLFNEADAIIGIRKEGAERSVDKMENTMRNIILQEMETLNGIMIATTNLTQNMDKAFERRFLYKIEFEKPDSKVRQKIWHSMIPSATESSTEMLADRFEFSGGQIENISRRYTIETILHGDPVDETETLMKFCESEMIVKQGPKKIGFC